MELAHIWSSRFKKKNGLDNFSSCKKNLIVKVEGRDTLVVLNSFETPYLKELLFL